MKNKVSIKKLVVYLIASIQLGIAVVFGYRVWSLGLLPEKYFMFYALWMLLMFVFTLIVANRKMLMIFMCMLSILLSGGLLFGMSALEEVHHTVEEVTGNPEVEKTEMVILVLADCEVKEISDLSEFIVGYMTEGKEENAEPVIEELKRNVGEGITFHEMASFTELVDALYIKTLDAIILDNAYVDILLEMEGYEDFLQRTKVVYSHEVINYIQVKDEEIQNPETEKELGQFVLYISGIDKFGHVSVKSRSDVNILAIVNTHTRQIQLINTPRDYYVLLPNSKGTKDKLTHADIYGVENSIGTLEMLYDIEIDYYLRLNFSGFEAIIDALGGIDVYSEYDFTVEPIKHYVKGSNHLTGLEALAFARERHAFKEGDHQRGKNQMAVITVTLNKLMSPELLYRYTDILQAVEGMFVTNFPSENIYTLVRQQLADTRGWTIETYAVTGTGSKQTTYSMPNTKVYVMIPDASSVKTAKEKIQAVLEAQ